MGTSKSSVGPGADVQLVPDWADNPPPEAPQGDSPAEQDGETPAIPEPAPARRFQQARRQLGDFGRNGTRASLERALGHYVRNGYGGSAYAARRMGGTANAAAALGNILGAFAGDGIPGQPALDRAALDGRGAQEVMDAIVEAARPVDGTQDAEASRLTMRDALSAVLERFPDADLLALEETQREFVIERFVALDVYQRFELDLGKDILDKAPSIIVGLLRLKDAKSYIVEAVAAAFRRLRNAGERLTASHISRVVRLALREAFVVFEAAVE